MWSFIWSSAYIMLWVEMALCALWCVPLRWWRRQLAKLSGSKVGLYVSRACMATAILASLLAIESIMAIQYHETALHNQAFPTPTMQSSESARRFRAQRNLYICLGNIMLLICLRLFISFNKQIMNLEETVMHLVEEQTKLMREINSTQSGKQPGKTAATNTTDASTVDKKSSATAPSQSAAGKAAADAQPLDTADAQLYVGGFANEVTERELQDFLQNHAKGKIHSVNIMKDEHGQTSGYARVMLSSSAAEALLLQTNLEMNGQWIKLAETTPSVDKSSGDRGQGEN